MTDTRQIFEEIIETGKSLYNRGYIIANEGNLSVRLSGGNIAITPAGMNKWQMKPEDLLVCMADGTIIEGSGRPSSEIRLHLAIYRWRPDIAAICHAHPIYATARSVAGKSLMRPILPEILMTLGGIPLASYGEPGTDELPKTLEKLIADYDAFLLESHGAVTLGKDMSDAFNKMETVERFAHILYIAETISEVRELPSHEVERLLRKSGRMNIMDDIIRASHKESRK